MTWTLECGGGQNVEFAIIQTWLQPLLHHFLAMKSQQVAFSVFLLVKQGDKTYQNYLEALNKVMLYDVQHILVRDSFPFS